MFKSIMVNKIFTVIHIKPAFFSCLLFFSLPVLSQDTVIVPKGVVYKKAGKELNDKARKLLTGELSRSTATYSIFDKVLYIGPLLWKRYSKVPVINQIKSGDIQFKVPNKGSTTLLPGKLIQDKAGFKIIWDQLLNDIGSNKISFRKLSSAELSYYWAVIFYDIEEPVFVVETGQYNFLIQLKNSSLKLVWIDEV